MDEEQIYKEIDKLLDAISNWRIPKDIARQRVRDWLCELSGIYEVGDRWERAIILPGTWEIE